MAPSSCSRQRLFTDVTYDIGRHFHFGVVGRGFKIMKITNCIMLFQIESNCLADIPILNFHFMCRKYGSM